ncbi:MAG: HetP family heterocyst commitment protein [Leptolyngbyaceae cyanobacterium SM2_5_2]|nr:HetP family heterocyst commitment protein [Leptolyngbyaceae cyanobacterium SM2_5_2]
MVSRFGNDRNRTMSEDQFCQVVDAILNGKYSWACLLILQFAGYNPLHYIPYRTYNRLMKENSPAKQRHQPQSENNSEPSLAVENLPHLHSLDSRASRVRGGFVDLLEYPFVDIRTILSRWN